MTRRVCWPDPDATCLEGGCLHCDGAPRRAERTIGRYAYRAGQVPNRYGGATRDAWLAYLDGCAHQDVKSYDPREETSS